MASTDGSGPAATETGPTSGELPPTLELDASLADVSLSSSAGQTPQSSRRSTLGDQVSLFSKTYTALFQGIDPSKGRPSFWDQLFLLKVNSQHLESLVDAQSEEKLVQIKDSINVVFAECLRVLEDENQIRAANAMLTLGIMMQGIFRKKFDNFGFDVIDVLMGFDKMEESITAFHAAVRHILQSNPTPQLKDFALKLLLITVTATEKPHLNPFVEQMMKHSFFDEIVNMFASKVSRETHGFQGVVLLGLLTSCSAKEGETNPYKQSLANITDELALSGIGSVISWIFEEKNSMWAHESVKLRPAGLLSNIGSMLGSMFASAEEEDDTLVLDLADSGGALLTLFQTVLLNANFLTILTHTRVIDAPNKTPSAQGSEDTNESKNLLSTFLTFASFVFAETPKSQTGQPFAKLCWCILLAITEDQHTNAFLHEDNLNLTATIFKAKMRHRPSCLETLTTEPLVVTLLGLCIEFLSSHLKKNLPIDLYSHCLGVIHRVLCYQKRTQTRLNYPYQGLWAALAGLIKFILKHEQHLDTAEAFGVANQAINICNFLMTYGDTLLSTLGCYDQMFYELIREHATFDALYDLAKRYTFRRDTDTDGSVSEASQRLVRDLGNIRSIVNHFCPRIKSWQTANNITVLTPKQVLAVVQKNYETLNLKLMDNLDHYASYKELEDSSSTFVNDVIAESASTYVGTEMMVEVVVVNEAIN